MLANHFLCYSLILESSGEFGKAGWASVHAAWACDDKQKGDSYRPPEGINPDEEGALIVPVPGQKLPKNGHGQADASQNCRKRAIALFLRARENDQSFATENGVEEAVLADLYRRSGNFLEAMDICRVGLEKDPDDRTRKILLFEEHVSDTGDSTRYTVADAEGTG